MQYRHLSGLVLALTFAASILVATPAEAVHDPLDEGEADSVFVVLPQPRLGIDSIATVELYFFNDVQTVVGVSLAMSWDNPMLQMDSAVFSPAARDAFSVFRYVYYKGDADSTNLHRFFQCSGGGFPADGLAAGLQPKLVVTYYFSLNDWASGESFCVDIESFVAMSFVASDVGEYEINWRGETCVYAGPDGDGDGVGDDWDNCPVLANPDQDDYDLDDIGDLCDLCTDSDGDNFGNPGFPLNECDEDNCPDVYNPGQEDSDGDGIGDVCDGCCVGRVGNANGLDGDEPTIGDIATMIDAKFITGTCNGIVDCVAEADINQSGGFDPTCADITIGDVSILIDYLFITGPELGLPDCL